MLQHGDILSEKIINNKIRMQEKSASFFDLDINVILSKAKNLFCIASQAWKPATTRRRFTPQNDTSHDFEFCVFICCSDCCRSSYLGYCYSCFSGCCSADCCYCSADYFCCSVDCFCYYSSLSPRNSIITFFYFKNTVLFF